MATAMHRIASTGAQEAADRDKVIQDRRFQHMVLNVEHNLKQMPESFGEQHLANVVWGAAKLRLQREDLFHFVQREVLSPRRQLDKFSPQQLAAIAWSYAMVNYQAPRLFEAVREEASRKPPLAEMLSKAGLLRDGNALSAAGGQRQGVSGAKSGVQQAGVGQANSAGLGQGMQNNGGMVNGPLQQRAQAQGQQRYGAHPPSQPQQQQQPPQPQPQQPHVQRPQQTSHAGPPSGYNQYDAGNGPGGQDASHGVARAAEEHKKEMEEKQRQVLGGEDGGELCPLCVEEMDSTDMALLPCPCGYQVLNTCLCLCGSLCVPCYQVCLLDLMHRLDLICTLMYIVDLIMTCHQICLLCLNKIRNEGNKQCPACRSEYEEGNFRKVEPPPKKKKNEARADDEGWESSTSKKKTGEKKKQPLSFPGFAPRVSDMLAQCHEAGVVSKGELDERVMEDLKALPERGAIAVLSEFMKKDMTRIRNKSAFVNGIIDRVQKELAHDKTGASLSGGGGGAPHGGWHGNQPLGYNAPVPEQQRPRGMSDIDSHNRPSMPPAGVQQQQKAQQLQPQPQQAMAGARPQQPIGGSGGVIGGGMQRGGGGGMGMLSWSAADDEEVDHMQNSLRGLGLGGSEKMGGASGDNSVLAGLAHDDQEAAEVERARQQVEQFLMSRGAGAQVQQQPPQHQQQFGGQGELPALGVGGLVPMGSAPMGSAPMGAFGGVGGLQDNLLGGLGAMSQGGGMRAPGASNMRAPGPIGSGHARQVTRL